MNLIPDQTPIDPNQFAVDWAVLFELLALIIVLAFVVERALAIFFETKLFVQFSLVRKKENKGDFKSLIAFGLSAMITMLYQLDLIAVLMSHEHSSLFGELTTAAVIAGGSKASIKLFQDILKVKSNEYDRAGKELAAHRESNVSR